MRRSSLVTTVALAGALAFGAVPTVAQRGGGGARMGGGHVGGGHVSGGPSGSGMRGGAQVYAPGAGVPRGTSGVRGGTFNSTGAFDHGSFGPRAPIHYYHPYYAFHPYFSVGFGLWAGYPVDWAYPYYYPPSPYYPNYPYYPYPYPYAPGGSGYSVAAPEDVSPENDATVGTAGVQPDRSNFGGLSFEITPSDAQVFVDGNYVGTVGDFTPMTQPLGVSSGRHHVEIRDVGYTTMSFDVDIVAGQVIPYQGQMDR